MPEIFIVAGFLGAGKTTLINGLLRSNQQPILIIENEVGNRPIDGDYLGKNEVAVQNILSGCICCTLAADFQQVIADNTQFSRIIIEPTGIAQLSTILDSLTQFDDLYAVTIVDAEEVLESIEFFGDFFADQIINADTLILNRRATDDELDETTAKLADMNPDAQLLVMDLAVETIGFQDLRFSRHQDSQNFDAIQAEVGMQTEIIENAAFDSFDDLKNHITDQFSDQTIYRVKGNSLIANKNQRIDYASRKWSHVESESDNQDLIVIFKEKSNR